MDFVRLLCLSVLLLAIAGVLMAVRIIVKKNGRFSSQHISQSKAMRSRGIHCVVSQDRETRAAAQKKLDVKTL